MRQRLITELGIAPDELKISTLSGLGVNRASPRTMMKIYRALFAELKKAGLTPAAIMPVAGIDPGTLEDRFTGLPWRGSVIAKTGTLLRTDGGASSLVGQMRAANGEVLLFVIMNQRGSVSAISREPGLPRNAGPEHAWRTESFRLQTADVDDETVANGEHVLQEARSSNRLRSRTISNQRLHGSRVKFTEHRVKMRPGDPKIVGALCRPNCDAACGTAASADDSLLSAPNSKALKAKAAL